MENVYDNSKTSGPELNYNDFFCYFLLHQLWMVVNKIHKFSHNKNIYTFVYISMAIIK